MPLIKWLFLTKREVNITHPHQILGFEHSIWHALCLSEHLSIYHLPTFLTLSHLNTHFLSRLHRWTTHTPGLHLLSLRWRRCSYWQVQNRLKVTGWCSLITYLIPLWPKKKNRNQKCMCEWSEESVSVYNTFQMWCSQNHQGALQCHF